MQEAELRSLLARKHNVKPDDLRGILLTEGFTHERTAGSHMVFRHPRMADTLSIPYRRPTVKPAYVRLAVEAIRKAQQE